MLDELGLVPALESLFLRLEKSTGLKVDFKHVGLADRLSAEQETAVYRVAQEALTNILRHSGVLRAMVRLWQGEGILGLQVADEGRGFAAAGHRPYDSLGLAGMRDRIAFLGGDSSVDSEPGAGTTIMATLPLDLPSGVEEEAS